MIKKIYYKSKLCIENKIITENTNSDSDNIIENKIITENTNSDNIIENTNSDNIITICMLIKYKSNFIKKLRNINSDNTHECMLINCTSKFIKKIKKIIEYRNSI